jgi:uncharacterized protein YggE
MNRSALFLTVLLLAVAAHGQINNLQGNSLNINTPSFPNIPNISIPTPSFPSFGNTAAPACAANCGWNTIDVNGASTLNVNPDIATLNVQVTGNGRTTTDAINNLSQKINNVLTTLTNIGLNSNNWQTTSLNVYPNSSFVNGR